MEEIVAFHLLIGFHAVSDRILKIGSLLIKSLHWCLQLKMHHDWYQMSFVEFNAVLLGVRS
jgi:hypothetical protein